MSEKKLEKICDYADLLVLAEKYSKHNSMVMLTIKYVFDHKIDVEKLKKAFNMQIERDNSLCERFVDFSEDKGHPVRSYFVDPYELNFESADFTGMSDEEQEKALRAIADKPIETRDAPFGRVTIIKTNDGRDGFVLTCNHYNLDSYGIYFTIKSVLQIYLSMTKGTPMPPMPADWHETKLKINAANTPELMKKVSDEIIEHFDEKDKIAKNHYTYAFDDKRSTNKKLIKRSHKFFHPTKFRALMNTLQDKGGFDIYNLEDEYTEAMKKFCTENSITLTDFWHMVMRTYDLWHSGREEFSFYRHYLNNRSTKAVRNTGGCTVNSCNIRVDVKNTATVAEAFKEIEKEFNFTYRHTQRPFDLAFSSILMSKYDMAMCSKGGLTCISVIPLDLTIDDEVMGDVEYYNSSYAVMPMYHLLVPGRSGSFKLYFIYKLAQYDKEQTNFMQQGYKASIMAITKLGMNATLNDLYDELDKTIGK